MDKIISRIGSINSDYDSFILKDVLVKNDAGDWGDEPREDAIGIIRSTNFTNEGKLDLSDVAFRSLKPNKLVEKKIFENEILIERSGGSETQPVGRVGLITKEIGKKDFAFANFIQRIALNDTVEPNYVFLCLQQMYEMGITRAMQYQTTGIRNLDWKLYTKSILPKPPKPEQTAIATILSKVDEAIAATQNSIKAAEKLKKALMQNLLTGKLKPDGSWRTEDEFYEDEKFGKVPKGWEVKKGKKIFKSYGSSSFDNINLSNQGDCIYMKVSDFSLEGNELYIEKANIMFSYENNEELKYCEPDYIVMSKRGEAIRKNRVRILAKRTLLDPNLMALKIIDGNPLFFKFLLEQMNLQRFLENSALPQLNNKDFYPRFYLYPPIEEQEEISNVLLNQHNLKRQKHFKIQNLQRLKKSLLQNLLTGKVRLPQEFIAQFEEAVEEVNKKTVTVQ